mmetsp:Transcript_54212/g.60615  ORF Transcript_54212/g.60615 Transcript_54212/m.60615 type:complete len:96 (+) Transcript_54212:256-543(+)
MMKIIILKKECYKNDTILHQQHNNYVQNTTVFNTTTTTNDTNITTLHYYCMVRYLVFSFLHRTSNNSNNKQLYFKSNYRKITVMKIDDMKGSDNK